MPDRLHLIRHAEVHNPEHLVYAGLPGFGLSPRGRRQAGAAAVWLADAPVVRVVSSPLQRAMETAAPLAAELGLDVECRDELAEWALSSRWAGHAWRDLPSAFPGELEAYLEDPSHLPFSPESLAEVGARVGATAREIWNSRPRPGHVAIVSHQDPIESARRQLTGRDLQQFHDDKPAHASVISLVPSKDGFREIMVFTPAQA